ncbi:MAG: ribosome-associated translation inhibitor RaiA [Crocinitomicaceae bacterium]|jgi:putative sigma-54 modulation protein|nr:ribosome-associated translation inhibitor RaiA [Crocinitomicaceae bacterium]MDG2464080.1 ribosome-associated translation inhibitor RaiA [Crocinitomicaceae bacterium]
MDIQVHSIHFTADKKLLGFVNEKVNKLEVFFDNIIAGEVYLRLDKNNAKDNKIAEVKLLIPGKELFAKKQCKSFEEAADLAVEALRKQVTKEKERK